MASYSFYDVTVPVLRNISKSAISFLTAAKEEISKNSSLPSEQELLDAKIGDMLPFRMQPILVASFPVGAINALQLNGSATTPALDPASFSSLDDIINFFKQMLTVYDAIDAKTYNESAEKSFQVSVGPKTLNASSLTSFIGDFVIPNSFFHLNAMYMLLRGKGFNLGKPSYIGAFMGETSQKDWAAMRASA
ncbi:hypothetical protein ACJQWK_11753 [Exserohilum turcicum]|uniref:Uncharacterized protein n=1 Tax=Exserohilum turcicum (strain 28A) TaxID=671987 RepID=R0KDI0_EXST2|nr:uncharacterized protein SETTUDRAFT_161427 [Exserohilum turcica Et28A]EOA86212.1 hypothetical protein SETTUDRAFT_161427 [Exserohilum turcica Et28A]